MEIKIIAENDLKSQYLMTVIKTALIEMNINIQVKIIENPEEIAFYTINQKPMLLINDTIISTGRVPSISEIKKLIG